MLDSARRINEGCFFSRRIDSEWKDQLREQICAELGLEVPRIVSIDAVILDRMDRPVRSVGSVPWVPSVRQSSTSLIGLIGSSNAEQYSLAGIKLFKAPFI